MTARTHPPQGLLARIRETLRTGARKPGYWHKRDMLISDWKHTGQDRYEMLVSDPHTGEHARVVIILDSLGAQAEL